ncbi:MAG TPA: undecaprenyl-diphosphate phosphatase, partial [Desulfuromonadaceae bacterium]|nr:undecaprenyl-diphosphate phosphatase [Desulfuromonadaceae bacterium]
AENFLHAHKSELFNVVIQCGAVLAVLPLFQERLYRFFFELRDRETQRYLLKVLTAFFITAVGGLAVKKFGWKLEENPGPVAWALLAGGILFLVVEFFVRGKKLANEITWIVVIAVAVGQLIAGVFPGTSRSGATILFALLLGTSRPAATEFSFLVGIPTMLAAGAFEILKTARHPDPTAPHENWGLLLLATAIAAVVSFFAVKWLLRYVQSHTFIVFGWYRIALAIVIFILMVR